MTKLLPNIRIAIADDHPSIRKAIKLVLSKHFVINIMAENGQDLLNQLNTKGADIVILDIQMPVMDGEETLKYLKIDFPELKVVMFSTHSDDATIERFKKLGANAFVYKGDSNKLVETILLVYKNI